MLQKTVPINIDQKTIHKGPEVFQNASRSTDNYYFYVSSNRARKLKFARGVILMSCKIRIW